MDEWGWEHVPPWFGHRALMPIRALFCVIDGADLWAAAVVPRDPNAVPTAGRRRRRRRRFAPHQLRHAHAVEMARESVLLNAIQRQLGHTDLGVTSIYLQGITTDNHEIINTIHARTAPMMAASAGLHL